ncbi:GvpL/GvpF family gas vesicle protein [Flavobacterium sp. GSP27]|uniref:GvpL/GvpF family gas vesicle protein n=1 Tax=unclassified Flavobacterium TaxID=196869 RepID=UPI000F82E508|nr:MULTISPECIES: GvpL/GvpF family gas vesicle protein [unclassified Flavobacterium]RTY94735.1 GvpL/GvpF family gas vesicle protein [Flavobacterium sp. GSN2]RTY67640.1 GvpL/GvpF family gas vesicle protein [Flavobacterium sp. LB2P53]RTY81529.1 GvpL/GvpF family gas vesicle protein [Flavobacterium sp. ZB4P23]RTY81716.1 GvpL/GvpF family gas vesicle protein [Flavobacterium sp. LS1P28]RTY91449.1 GvpL/GvpF family gas vesicle protein [Flavobacterium sp. RSP46]
MEKEVDIPKEGKYIYGIIRHSDPLDYGPIGMGKRTDLVYGINFKDISAIVSNSPIIEYEVRRINMITHERVLEEVMKQFTVLPVRFSTISEHNDDSGILRILEKDYKKFDDLLTKMEGKKELGLKVLTKEAVIYESIIEKYDEIRLLRGKLMSLPADKSHYQRMKIGEMVAEALKKETENYKNSILDILNPLSVDVKINDSYGEMMIINVAFLVKNLAESAFDKAVNDLEEKFGRFMTFKYVGTLPLYNFVTLVINTKGI